MSEQASRAIPSGAPDPVPAGWEPVTEVRDDVVTARSAAALHGLLDAPGRPPGAGDPLPPLWHWLAFLPDAAQAELGDDGHPRLGGFLPPLTLARRMFAGARLKFADPVTVEAPLRRRSVVADVTVKSGRSGDLVFVQVSHEIGHRGVAGNHRPVIFEAQDLVYRDEDRRVATDGAATSERAEAPERGSTTGTGSPGPPPPDDEQWIWRFDLGTEPTLLFRFSALTYNAHRIHYDRDYATGVEDYPGLVVHGPLQAIGLAELCRRHVPARLMTSYSFRARRTAFDGPALRLRGRPRGSAEAELVAFDANGEATMTAQVAFAEA